MQIKKILEWGDAFKEHSVFNFIRIVTKKRAGTTV